MESGEDKSGAIGIAIAASIFKDSLPWIYEMGMEAFRQQLFGNKSKAKLALEAFRKATRISSHPSFRQFSINEKETMFVSDELDMFLNELEDRELLGF